MQLINGECIEEMQKLQDHSIDFIFTDLPYGTTNCSWDAIVPFDKLWEQYERLLKQDGVVALFGVEPFSSALVMSNPKHFKYNWIWNKKSAGNHMNARFQPLKIHENISIFCYGKNIYYPVLERGFEDRTDEKPTKVKGDIYHKINSGFYTRSKTNKPGDARYPKSIIEISKQSSECGNGKSVHPTQKPVKLLEYIINTYTKKGDVVLDSCMGSGSTDVAAINTERDFVGIEINEDYFNIAKERINKSLLQR